MDNKLVHLSTTIESPFGTIDRKTCDKKSRRFVMKDVPYPAVFSAYNHGKVGTDRMDQVIASYYRNSRFRWSLKIIVHLTYMCMVNAYINYCDTSRESPSKYRLLEFITTVCEDLNSNEPGQGSYRDPATSPWSRPKW